MTIVNFQGVREIFYNYNEISEVWYNSELVWKKPVSERTLLFSGKPTTEFKKLDLYKTYIFERPGYPTVTKEATDLDFGYIEIGDGYLTYNKTVSGLYIKSYGTAFDVKIYGKN
ncbi:hypothetical protein [Streptococcus dysgalactiae]|uniref:hypothetical protein n=1 Tax=Streptococcus dysgalactiae TaxID=1334 RepID=UPI0022B706B2|nr:hypothetical protein [Streptococcus dysgalactiae]